MRTIEEAIAEETQRYIEAASDAAADPDSRAFRARLHYRSLALKRLRHHAVTPHEAVCAATPSVHAHGAGR